jgi:hypothetical protein
MVIYVSLNDAIFNPISQNCIVIGESRGLYVSVLRTVEICFNSFRKNVIIFIKLLSNCICKGKKAIN